MKPLVYIAGPITKGCQSENVSKACAVWGELHRMEIDAYCPHWSVLQQFVSPISHKAWLDYDTQVILPRCDALLRLDGDSVGADIEAEWMKEHGKPVFYEIAKLAEWYSKYDRNSDVFHGCRAVCGSGSRAVRSDLSGWLEAAGPNVP